MAHPFAYVVTNLSQALIWKGSLQPGSDPLRLHVSEDNPEYRKEHKGRSGGRDNSKLDQKFAAKISRELIDASHIYLLCAGSGKANTAHQLLEYLKENHAKIAEKVLEIGIDDVNSLSENQLLELGRKRMELFVTTAL